MRTNTISYVVWDAESLVGMILDSVLDYEPNGGRIFYESAEKVIFFVKENRITIEWIIETHAHADHLSAARYLKKIVGGKIGIGKEIVKVQDLFKKVFDEDESFRADGSQFDYLFSDGEEFMLGNVPVKVLHTPGHTPADYSFIVGDGVFVGDTLFMPDFGSARCDFPNGSAEILYESSRKLFTLPDEMKMFMCHDYLPDGRKDFNWITTVGEQKEKNIHLNLSIDKNTFVEMRTKRDKALEMPKLIIPSIQVNIRAGEIPKDAMGKEMLKIPINDIFAKKT